MYAVPEDVGIVPAIVKGYILACFLAVLVRYIERLLVADSTDNFQIFFRKIEMGTFFLPIMMRLLFRYRG